MTDAQLNHELNIARARLEVADQFLGYVRDGSIIGFSVGFVVGAIVAAIVALIV